MYYRAVDLLLFDGHTAFFGLFNREWHAQISRTAVVAGFNNDGATPIGWAGI